MYWTKKHVLVCNASHCTQKGANDVAMQLRREVLKRGLDDQILVNNCGTIDLCDIGPNIVVYPDNIIYSGVQKQDVAALVDALVADQPLDQLVLNAQTPAEAARRAFYAAAVTPEPTRRAPEFAALAAEHGFDEGWIAEQQRRGFIARKPATGEAPETISVTKKSRVRYGV